MRKVIPHWLSAIKSRWPSISHRKFEKISDFRPNDAANWLNLGISYHRQGKNEPAIKHINKALSIQPDFVEALNNMGLALQDQGKLDEAMEAYNKALSIQPDFAEAYYNMGICLQSMVFDEPNRNLQKMIVSSLIKKHM